MILLVILWIIAISFFCLLASWYARKYEKPDALIGLYVTFVLISNFIAIKIVEFNFGFVKVFATAATLVFSVTFLLTDIVNEKFGRRETHKMIFIAFVCQIATAFFILMAIYLPSAYFWGDQEIFVKVFGFAPRIMLASWIAFLASENADAYIFAFFKKLTKGKHLWIRNAFSSVPAMALDTIIFVVVGFYNIQPLLPLIVGVIAIKWMVAIIDIPFMYLSRKIMLKM
ncbi:MAG: queuosine precursor transporter [Candidatus Nanoarchaeia archaeon]|nr:queuosine precursor transporter [Candidatus Nanoarchaeia archaeon]MDD5741674.1 queuosine precursor transporter [Candidatus Nanoarchaeia archaeon]